MSSSRIFLLLAAFGAYPLVEGIAPAWPASASASTPADDRPTSRDQPAAQDSPSLRWISRKADGKDATVEVIGIDRKTLSALEKQPEMTRERWMSCLAVRVLPALPSVKVTDTPPLLGSYRVEGNVIRFVPRFPLEPGLRYRAEFDLARLLEIAGTDGAGTNPGAPTRGGPSRISAEFAPPKRPSTPSAVINQVYPDCARGFRRICSGSTSISPPR